MQVADGIHRIDDPFVGSYLLEAGGRLTVIDTGLPRTWPRIAAGLASLGWGLDQVEAVLVTHAHPDHLGSAERLRTESGADVHIHPEDAPVATGERRWRPNLRMPWWRPGVVANAVRGLLGGALRVPPVAEVVTFEDGEVLDVPGRPRVVHAPGHTPGSCALYAEGRRALFVGDVLATVDIVTGREGPMLSPAFANDDNEQALASLDRLDGIAAAVLLPGHGRPWTGGVPEALAHARRIGIHP